MIYGIDYIGGINYTKVIEKHHPAGYAAGFLCKAEGWKNGIKAARALAETGKCSLMRIHGLWKDDHDFNLSDITTAVKQAKKVAKLKESYPDIDIYYSPWLEHRASQKLFKACKKECKAVLPKEVEIVSSGTELPNGITEFHTTLRTAKKEFFSFDGVDMLEESSSDIYRYIKAHEHAKVIFAWIVECNGLENVTDNTPRAERKNWLTRGLIKAIEAEFNEVRNG